MSTAQALQELIENIVDAKLKAHGLIEQAGSDDDDDEPAPAKSASKGGKTKSKPIDVDAVKEKLLAYVNEKGKPAAVKMLKKFGAESVAKLKDSKYADFVAAIDAELSADSDDDDDDDDDIGL